MRVGVVVDEGDVRRWHETAMDQIEQLGFCEVLVLIREPNGGGSTGVRETLRHALYSAYELADRRVFGSDEDPLAM